ncbi:MAG: DUF5011 domain-containing protein [Clostridia bacterium]|nr:DUF5011 domain-containing protein [Clostridia bacterium]
MKKKKLPILACIIAALCMLAAFACSNQNKDNGADTTPPVITVAGVPTTCKVGDVVTLPAATATDDKDGDVTASIKVTVSLLKADGSVQRDLVYEKPGNVSQSFTVTSNTQLNYRITYSVKDAAGNKGESVHSLVATADNEKPTLKIEAADAAGYTIAGKAGADITLPAAVAIDQPGDVDISNRVQARMYEVIGGEPSSTLFASYADFTAEKKVRIPMGNYQIVYSVSDIAGNAADKTYTIPVAVGSPEITNLAADPANFVLNNQEGMSWVNEYGEIAFGNTSAKPTLSQTVGITENVAKIYDQYVAISFNADVPGPNGQMFYSFSARGSKDRNTVPNAETCTWPSYLFLRFSGMGIESRSSRTVDKPMKEVKGYKTALVDGKDHTVYAQWRSEGDSATAANARIRIYGWIDKTPAGGTDTADFIFEVVAAETDGEGTLATDTFVEMWNETGAGWFGMDSYGQSTPYGDDHMRIKSFVIYDADETEFALDISAPVIDAAFDTSPVYALNEEIVIPTASVEDEDEDFDPVEALKYIIVKPDGTKADVTDTQTFTPTEKGMHKLLIEAKDTTGNYGYKAFAFRVAQRDTEKPVVTVDKSALTVAVGSGVTLPDATASDNVDGDISARIEVEIIGTEHLTGLKPGDAYSPMTAGAQKAIYRVSDEFGNVSEEIVPITVNGNGKTGNLLGEGEVIASANSGRGLASEEYVYDQKVSMILNIEKLGSIIQFNTRGPVQNQDWPKGLVIRFTKTGIDVSSYAHDVNIYGTTSWALQKYMVGCDVLFEYQNKNVVIDGEEYIRTQIWLQGEALKFTADGGKGGVTGLEQELGNTALYRKVSAFTGNEVENIYSSPIWFMAYDSSAVIKEVRIDGTSCDKPADPVVPDGFENPVTQDAFAVVTEDTENGTLTMSGKDYTFRAATGVNENYVAVNYTYSCAGSTDKYYGFGIQVLGEASSPWAAGILVYISSDGVTLRQGGITGTVLATLTPLYPQENEERTLVYKLTYVPGTQAGLMSAVTLEIWEGPANGELVKIGGTVEKDVSYNADSKAFTIPASICANKAAFTHDCTMLYNWEHVNGKGTRTTTITVSVEKYDESPDAHEHTFDTSAWQKDDTGHWHAATCGHNVKGDFAAHDYKTVDGQQKCSVCDYIGHEHTFDTSAWQKDDTGHWYAATCEHTTEKGSFAEHAYNADWKCTVCEYQHLHNVDETRYVNDAGGHWYPATCGHISISAHTFVEDGGVKKCSVCNFEPYQSVAGTDYTKKLLENVGDGFYSVTFTRSNHTKYGFFLNVLGKSTGVWNGGVVMRITGDNTSLTFQDANPNVNVKQISLNGKIYFNRDTSDTWTIVYSVKHNADNVQLQMWVYNPNADEITWQKFGGEICADFEAAHPGMVTYDAETNTYTLQYALFGEGGYATDCTVLANNLANSENAFIFDAAYLELTTQAVVEKIDAIGTVEYTAASQTKIAAARAAYNALLSDLRGGVTNFDTLTAAEAAFKTLSDEKTEAVVNAMKALTATSDDAAKNAALGKYDELLDLDKVTVNAEFWNYILTLTDKTEYIAAYDFLWNSVYLDKTHTSETVQGMIIANQDLMASFMKVFYNVALMNAIDAIPTDEITAENAEAYKKALEAAVKAYGEFKTNAGYTDEVAQEKCFNYAALTAAQEKYAAYEQSITPAA